MNCISRKNIVVGLAAAGIIGFLAYAGDQYASFIHDMNVLAKSQMGTVFIRGEIHGHPFKLITNVKVSTVMPGMFIVLGEPYSYTLLFQGMKGNKARLKFVVWQRQPLAADHGWKSDKSQTMVWEAVVPSMTEKLATKCSPEPIYSPMSGMHYLPNTPVSAADGKVSGNAGTQNELQAAWIGAPEALGDDTPGNSLPVVFKKGMSAPVTMVSSNGQQWEGIKGSVRDMGKAVAYRFQIRGAYSGKAEIVHGLMPLRNGVATIALRPGIVPAVKG